MQWFTSFLPRLPMFFIVLFCFQPKTADAASYIKKSPETFIPPIVYSDENETEQSVSLVQNKLTVLHFWATWCIPCIKELPEVNAAQKKYGGQGFKVIALSLDGKGPNIVNTVKKFYQDNNIDALELSLDPDMKIFRELKVKGLPTTIFVNSHGMELARTEGALPWEDKEVERFISQNLQ